MFLQQAVLASHSVVFGHHFFLPIKNGFWPFGYFILGSDPRLTAVLYSVLLNFFPLLVKSQPPLRFKPISRVVCIFPIHQYILLEFLALREFFDLFLFDLLREVAAALSAAAFVLYSLLSLFPVTYDRTLYPPLTLSTGIIYSSLTS